MGITDEAEIGAENGAWRAYLESRHSHHATDAFRAGWIAGQNWGQQAAVDTAVAELTAEVERLTEGIRRYMAADPPHAGDCASMDPCPRRGPCDCGVNDFIRAALGESPT